MGIFPAPGGQRLWVAVILGILMLGALGLRLSVVWQRLSQVSDESALQLVGDESGYEALANALLQGSFFHSPVRGPVYPLFIAAVYAVFGERSPARLLYVQACIGMAVVPLTYLLARRVTGSIPALVAAGIVAGNDALIDHAQFIYSEIVYTPLLLIALLALYEALQTPRRLPFARAGLSMAVITHCRPTTALFPLLLPLLLPRHWTRKQQLGACLAYGLAMGMLIAPWTYHNWRLYHRFIPFTISSGVLWQGSPEFYHLTQQQRTHLDIWAHELNPQRNGGYDTQTIEGDRYFNQRGLRSIWAEPGVYVIYSLKKAVYLWLGNPAAEWDYVALYDWPTMRSWHPYTSGKLLNMFVARQLPLLALGALVFLAIRRQLRPLLPLIAVCAYFTLIHMITWAEMRYSQPLHPLLAIFLVTAGGVGYRCLTARHQQAKTGGQ